MSGRSKTREILVLLPAREALPDRLTAFMKKYNLTSAGMALVLQTPHQTIRKWLSGNMVPQATAVPLLTVLEGSAEAREILGVTRYRHKGPIKEVPETDGRRNRIKRQHETARGTVLQASFQGEDDAFLFDEELFIEGPLPRSR